MAIKEIPTVVRWQGFIYHLLSIIWLLFSCVFKENQKQHLQRVCAATLTLQKATRIRNVFFAGEETQAGEDCQHILDKLFDHIIWVWNICSIYQTRCINIALYYMLLLYVCSV